MKRGYAETDLGQLHYWTTGNGPNLVLLHQSTQNADEYLGLVPLLAETHTLTAIEWLGHGKSADTAAEPTMTDYSRTVIQAMEALEIETMALLGHHGGAAIALDIAATIPDRVTRVVASGTGYRSPEDVAEMLKERKTIAQPITADGAFLNKMWGIYTKLGSPGTSLDVIHRIFLNNMQERLKPFDAHDPILKWNKAAACAKITCPLLLLQGDLDSFVSGQEKLLEKMPTARRVVMANAGPFCFYDKPDEMAAVVAEFLAGG
ncbi:MAG: alpha/beta hydrolase [Proteobacteria bacterium]|nr:alpha/beta hydrolase [Pseudomonadota bacterium]